MIDQVINFEYKTRNKRKFKKDFVVGSNNVGCCHCKLYGICVTDDLDLNGMLPICSKALDYFEAKFPFESICVTPLMYYVEDKIEPLDPKV